MTAPFTAQGEAAVCARVALAWLRLQRVRRDMRACSPNILIGVGVEELRGLQLTTVRLALLSLSVWVTKKKRSEDWLAGVIMRDYYGFSIRRCYYAEYKANRRG
jgi:hypothetical protein